MPGHNIMLRDEFILKEGRLFQMKPVDVHGNMLRINLDHPPPETTKVATHFF